MRFNVAQLIRGPIGQKREYHLEEDITDLDPDLTPVAPLTGVIQFTRTSQGILVTGRAETTLEFTCDRCLEPYRQDVAVELEEEFYPTVDPGETPLDEVSDIDREDEALRIDEHHTLDLWEVVRQNLMLAVPVHPVCRPDCAGLCPRCGENRNEGLCQCPPDTVDPRWASLQAWVANPEGKE
jgi:uncharacterized protein